MQFRPRYALGGRPQSAHDRLAALPHIYKGVSILKRLIHDIQIAIRSTALTIKGLNRSHRATARAPVQMIYIQLLYAFRVVGQASQ